MRVMSTGYVQALSLLHHTFKQLPATKRAHILGRFLTCPFLRVLPELPPGRVLDIGAGDGLFARLATEDPEREVIALEPDLRKTLSAIRRERVRWVAGYLPSVRGSFAAVMMFDVLYRIPLEARDELLGAARDRLAPGGLLLIKELDPSGGWKARWNRMQETISDRFLKLTLGDAFAYESREELEERLRRLGFSDVRSRPIDDWYPHAHILFSARRAEKPLRRPSRVIGPIL
jgi:SAM-dependent methyltransferase